MKTEHHGSREFSAEELMEMASTFQKSSIILAAFELELFSIIGEQSLSSQAISSRAGTDPRATDRLLNALCTTGLICKNEGVFCNSQSALKYLVKDAAGYLSGIGHMVHLYRSWSTLADAVRRGGAVIDTSAIVEDENCREAFIEAMHRRARETAPRTLGHLNLDGVSSVLDVGGGSGVFSIALARMKDDLRAVVFDLPGVTDIAQRYISEAALDDRISLMTGNYKKDSLGNGYDLILLSAIVHSNSFAENEKLVEKCFHALNPGGIIAIHDFVMSEDRVAPPRGAIFALNMVVNTAGGDSFTEREIGGWLKGAGCVDVKKIATGPATSWMVGRRES